jgi:ribose-phosphate pyrophosphokinase
LDNEIYLLSAGVKEGVGLAQKIKTNLLERGEKVELLEPCLERFADGCCTPNIPISIRNKKCFVVVEYQGEGDSIWDTALILAAAQKSSRGSCYVVEPYFRSSRGDKVSGRGCSSLNAQMRIYECFGVSGYVVLDAHDDHLRSMTSLPCENLLILPCFEKRIRALIADGERAVFFAPDHTAQARYGKLAEQLGLPLLVDPKSRTGTDTFVRKNRMELDLAGATAFVVDDICGTGGTLGTSVLYLRQNGAGKVHVLVTHGATGEIGEAFADPLARPDTIAVSNTTPFTYRFQDICACEVIDVTPILAEAIKIIASNGSLERLILRNS